jgi:lysophospholipase L1-like esterase
MVPSAQWGAAGGGTLGRAAQARRIAVRAAVGGGGVGVLGVALAGLLVGQSKLVRRAIGDIHGGPPRVDGVYGADLPGEPLLLAVLGDSAAAGLGCELASQTPGALLATGLTEVIRRPVRVASFAVVGALSRDLEGQVDRAVLEWPDLVMILIGGNDVVQRVRAQDAVRELARAVRRLRSVGAEVVVGTCPDLSSIEPLHPPLEWLARRWSRTLAAAQTIAVVEAGGRTVSLGDLLGPEFARRPKEMFAADRFHPSPAGYASAAAAILPSLIASLEPGGEPADRPDVARGEGVRSLPQAAVEAADAAGTEVSATAIAGRDRGPWGRWVELRHRIRVVTRRPAGPDAPVVAGTNAAGALKSGNGHLRAVAGRSEGHIEAGQTDAEPAATVTAASWEGP